MRIKWFVLGLVIVMISSCTGFRPLDNESPVRNEFEILSEDHRILYKIGAMENAKKIAPVLDELIKKIESGHGEKFTKNVIVHVCDTPECFSKYTGRHPLISAAVSENGLFLSPRAFKDDRQNLFLAHELSHLHLFQQIFLLRTLYVPQWFHEGVATYYSDGGGAQHVDKLEAIKYIDAGKHFIAIESAGLFGKGGAFGNRWPLTYKASTDNKFQQHMNYRQAQLFCEYLDKNGKVADLLRLIENGTSFKTAFQKTFSASPQIMWLKFVADTANN